MAHTVVDDREICDRAVANLRLGRVARLPPDYIGTPGYEHLRRRAQQLIDSAREHVRSLPPIYLDFVANGRVNAFAFKDAGRYFIGITTGTVFMLEFVLMRMLSDRRLFPQVADPSGEDDQLLPLSCCQPSAELMANAGYIAAPPKTRGRHVYASLLFEQAMMFLVGHEIAHISLGHVDYLEAKLGAAIVSELLGDPPSCDDLIERQCMETQADMRSAYSRASSIILTCDAPDPLPRPWAEGPMPRSELIFMWAFAMNSLFRLFGDGRFDSAQMVHLAYPPLPVRRLIATGAAYPAFVQWDPTIGDEATRALRTAIRYAEHAFAVLLGEETRFDALQEAVSPEAHAHHEMLGAYIPKLNERLERFAYEKADN